MTDAQTKAILELPIATEDGKTLYHCSGWAAVEHIVVVEDNNGSLWMRGKDHHRYGIITTSSKSSAAFTRLDSGRQ